MRLRDSTKGTGAREYDHDVEFQFISSEVLRYGLTVQ